MAYRLLLADDSITIQKVVELTLSEEDFEVTAYGDGESALEAARRQPPDIILADVFMPGLDGYELCGRLRQDPALKDVPVMLMVGTFEDFDEDSATRAGADDHITKPFESSELISKIKMLVEQRGARPEEELMAAELVEEAEPALEAGFVEEVGFVEEAELVEESELEGEVVEAEPASLTDDLWSVVDLNSETQPTLGATEILTEDEIWRRANLISDSGEGVASPSGEEGMPWDELPVEPVLEEEEPEEALIAEECESPEMAVLESSEASATAILDLDALGAYTFAHEGTEEPALAEEAGLSGMLDVESLDEATVSDEFVSPSPTTQPAEAVSVSPEEIREEILKAVNSVLDQKIKEVLSAISKDVIERIVWDVVPGLAEEIIVKEIEKLKAGVK